MRHIHRLVGLLAVASIGCSSGGSGSTGDDINPPPADPYGNGARLQELMGPATWLDDDDPDSLGCADVPADFAVNVTGVTLVAKDDYDETGTGAVGNYYVQDTKPIPPLEFAGMTVFRPGFSPPDLRVINGDVVDLFGQMTEFIGPGVGKFGFCRTLPEISGAMSFRFEGSELTPVTIDVEALKTYATARPYFGMLVRLDNVGLAEDPFESASGRYSVRMKVSGNVQSFDIPTITNELMDLKTDGPEMAAGDTLTSIVGVVTYFYGVHIAPRDAADITK